MEKPVLEELQRAMGNALEIRWHAFELRPSPVPTLDPKGEYLQSIWARAVYPLAAERSLALRLPPVQPRSRRAFEAAEFARHRGKFDKMHWLLFRALFEEGKDLNDLEVLSEIGERCGLKKEELRASLQTGQYTHNVIADEQLAADLGVTAVPCLLMHRPGQPLEEAVVVRGAQSYESLSRFINQVAC